jgi:hypothetical protein
MKRRSSETWLEPAVAIEFKACHVLPSKQMKSWENPPVTSAPARSSSCAAGSQMLASRPQWLQPSLFENVADLKAAGQQVPVCISVAPNSKMDTVELTLASVLLATSLNTEAIVQARKGHAERVKQVLQMPCPGRVGIDKRCSRCKGEVAEEDAVLFCTLFAAMPKKIRCSC